MAAKYARAGGGNWTADATWSTTSGGAADTTAPTAADDAFLDASSGNVTVNAAAVCRSLNCTGYTGTLTHNAFTLSIGDATAGASNIALKFVAGMTYTLANAITSGISFVTTSATVQTIDFAGKTTGSVTFNATSNGSWQYIGAHNTGVTAIVTLTKGTLDVNGQTCSWGSFLSDSGSTRSLILGAASITITKGSFSDVWKYTGSNTTLSAASSTITFSADTAQMGGPNGTYGSIIFSGGSAKICTWGSQTCANVTFTGTASKTLTFRIPSSLTVTGTLSISGNSSTNRVLVQSDTVGTSMTINAATVSVTNADFQDITGAGAGSWDLSAITGGSGDCGGNSGITFTTAATQTYTGGTDNWSTAAKWTSRVPLPQDNVLMSGVTGGTITADMPRLGKSIDWTGASGSPTFNPTNCSMFGSLTIISAMSWTGAGSFTFAGRGSYTITSAGKQTSCQIIFAAPTGTYTLLDAFSTTQNLLVNYGAFVTSGFNVTFLSLSATSTTATRSLTLGSSTMTSSNTATAIFWDTSVATGLTLSASSATVVLSASSANTRTFAGGGQTFGTLTYTVAGSTGQLNITGANSFAAINFSDATNARTLAFTAATTTTIRNTNGFNVQGTSGKVMTIASITAATHTLSSTNTQSCDYLHLTNSIATGGGSWYAGANSTDNGGNTGWIFTAAPPSVKGSPARQSLRNLQNLMSL